MRERKLVVNESEADLVRLIFKRFLRVGSATKLAQELRRAGHTTKSWVTQDGRPRQGKPIDKGALYKILNNRVYLGEAVHKGTSYPGEHEPIIDRATWDKVHAMLAENTVARTNRSRAQTPALLRGLIFAPGGHAMTPTHTRKNGKLYRYYVATDAIRRGYAECAVRSVPAAELEEAVVAQVRHLLRTPEIIARTWAAAKGEGNEAIPERDVVKTITEFAPLWDELFPGRAGANRPTAGRAGRSRRWWLAGPLEGRRTAVVGRGTAVARGQSGMRKKRAVAGQDWEFDGKTITVHIPMNWKRRGGRKVIIAPDGGDAWAPAKPRPDETLIRALAQGASVEAIDRGWDLRSAAEIAEAEGVTRSFVNRLLRLTLLAPDIVEAILEGRQPKAMHLEELTAPFRAGG